MAVGGVKGRLARALSDAAVQATGFLILGWLAVTAAFARTWRGWVLGLGLLLLVEAVLAFVRAVLERKPHG